MKTRKHTFFLLMILFCCSLQPLWGQPDTLKTTGPEEKREKVFKKAFARFMEKVRTQSYNTAEKHQMAEEYSELIDEMDALYHAPPTRKSPEEIDYMGLKEAAAQAVAQVGKRPNGH